MQRHTGKVGIGPQVLAGAVAGFAAAWAMSEFQKSWVNLSHTRRKHRPRTDEEVMEEVVRRVNFAAGAPSLRKRDRERLGIAMHYAFATGVGALYAAFVSQSELATTGFGTVFASALFAVLDGLGPRDLKPLVNNNRLVSEVYGWLAHVIYGLSLESGRRGLTALMSRAT